MDRPIGTAKEVIIATNRHGAVITSVRDQPWEGDHAPRGTFAGSVVAVVYDGAPPGAANRLAELHMSYRTMAAKVGDHG